MLGIRGPLINIDGEVVGINTMKAAQGDGIGFAIPIDTAWQVIKQLRAHKRVVRFIGIKMVTLDARIIAHERARNKGSQHQLWGHGCPGCAGSLRKRRG